MKKETTATRLKKIMDERNLRQVDILEKAKPYCEMYNVKMNKSDISQYCSGKVEPHQEKLYILGCALNVSEAWLMGYDVPMEKDHDFNIGDAVGDMELSREIDKAKVSEPTEEFALSESEIEMVETFRDLDDFGKDTVRAVLEKESERCQEQQDVIDLVARSKRKFSDDEKKQIIELIDRI